MRHTGRSNATFGQRREEAAMVTARRPVALKASYYAGVPRRVAVIASTSNTILFVTSIPLVLPAGSFTSCLLLEWYLLTCRTPNNPTDQQEIHMSRPIRCHPPPLMPCQQLLRAPPIHSDRHDWNCHRRMRQGYGQHDQRHNSVCNTHSTQPGPQQQDLCLLAGPDLPLVPTSKL